MSYINTYPMSGSTILRMYADRDLIEIDPDYQRSGGIWTLEKRQLLIDSILNDYDIPKLYVHHRTTSGKRGKGALKYAVIDGRQRLESIWAFIDCKFTIAEDFVILKDPSAKIGGLTYTQLGENYPRYKTYFDSFVLPVIFVETDDKELIEDMFSRLNEAVPLNAAEKRNAFGGAMAKAIREVASSKFFKKKVALSDSRYKHYEVVARMLFLEYCIRGKGRLIDTKKPYLDNMVKGLRRSRKATQVLVQSTTFVLNHLYLIFNDRDSLLRAQAPMTVYYLAARVLVENGKIHLFNRNKLLKFFKDLKSNRKLAITDFSSARFDLLEYERLGQQGTNDANSIIVRVNTLLEYLSGDKDLKYRNQ